MTIVDTKAPMLNLPADIAIQATSSSGEVVTFPVSATDIASPNPTITCIPASGSLFPLGTTLVKCTVIDASGNVATGSFNVTVKFHDTVPPTISVPPNLTIEATSALGAVVTYTVTAADSIDGTTPVTCNPPSGFTFPLGNTLIICNATDMSGNSASNSFSVIVVDTIPPKITVSSSITVPATSSIGAKVTFTVSASDLVDGTVVATCSHASGSNFPIGMTVVTCTATDSSGNSASASFNVEVRRVQFADLTVEEIELESLEIKGSFTLGSASNGVNPLVEEVTLTYDSFSITIPAGSFKLDENKFSFEGRVSALQIEIKIKTISSNSFEFEIEVEDINSSPTNNPVYFELVIGDDAGSASISLDEE